MSIVGIDPAAGKDSTLGVLARFARDHPTDRPTTIAGFDTLGGALLWNEDDLLEFVKDWMHEWGREISDHEASQRYRGPAPVVDDYAIALILGLEQRINPKGDTATED